jgi:hypothetical protein
MKASIMVKTCQPTISRKNSFLSITPVGIIARVLERTSPSKRPSPKKGVRPQTDARTKS